MSQHATEEKLLSLDARIESVRADLDGLDSTALRYAYAAATRLTKDVEARLPETERDLCPRCHGAVFRSLPRSGSGRTLPRECAECACRYSVADPADAASQRLIVEPRKRPPPPEPAPATRGRGARDPLPADPRCDRCSGPLRFLGFNGRRPAYTCPTCG